MLDQARLEASLPIFGLGKPLYHFRSIDSTNAKALELAAAAAPHGTLVVADEQTAGRGRAGRRWITLPGSGIALSLLLRWDPPAGGRPGALSVFGALGVVEAARQIGADAQIKWPNDVLVGGRKVGGVLVEAQWQGSGLVSAVIGIGVNVRRGSVPPPDVVDFPAGCLEDIVGGPIDLNAFLLALVRAAGRWYPKLGSLEMLQAWESRLAFCGSRVEVTDGGARRQGRLAGLDKDGQLILEAPGGKKLVIGPTASDLRPIDSGTV